MASKAKKSGHVDGMTRDEFMAKVDEIRSLAQQLDEAVQGFVSMTDEDRLHSDGRFRNGESAALRAILDVVDKAPELFRVLADKDNGTDPETFETQLLRDRVAMRDALAGTSDVLSSASQRISDTVLHLGERTKPVLLTAYQIAKSVAKHNTELKGLLSVAINFYARKKSSSE